MRARFLARVALGTSLGLVVIQNAALPQQEPAVDPELQTGIRQVQAGDFDLAVGTLDSVARRLAQEGGRSKELARAYAYLAVSYIGLNHVETAKAKFLEAWKADKDLSIDTTEFPPNIVKLFEDTLRDVQQEARAEAAAAASPSAPPADAPAAKKGKGKGVVIGLAAGGAVGVALAVGGGGSSSGSSPSPPLPTPAPTPVPPPAGNVAFVSSDPPPGSTISLGSAVRGGRVLRVTASVGVNRTGHFRLTVQDKWPDTCFMGYVDLPLTANQTVTTTLDLYYPVNPFPHCPPPFTTTQLAMDLRDPTAPDTSCCLVGPRYFALTYTFVP